jgi:hypothetical protein
LSSFLADVSEVGNGCAPWCARLPAVVDLVGRTVAMLDESDSLAAGRPKVMCDGGRVQSPNSMQRDCH